MSIITKIIPNSIKKKLRERWLVPDMFWSLENMKRSGFNPKKIIDIGAYQGEWTEEVITIFPNASFLMAEAMPAKKPYLDKVVEKHKNVQYEIGVLGSSTGKEIVFHEMETASSVLEEYHNDGVKKVITHTNTLDDLAIAKNFLDVDLVKLDTQGYELEILKGADKVMNNVQAVLMEISLLDLHKNVPVLADVIVFMKERNFVAFDICSMTRRPLDKALWQTDIIFVKENSSLRTDKRWGK